MTRHQRYALEHHCRFAFETALPGFGLLDVGGKASIVLSVNSGGPVWHASAAPLPGHVLSTRQLRLLALAHLASVGDRSHEWLEESARAYHLRRRLTPEEEALTGPAIDLRDTPEGWERFRLAFADLPRSIHHWAMRELKR